MSQKLDPEAKGLRNVSSGELADAIGALEARGEVLIDPTGKRVVKKAIDRFGRLDVLYLVAEGGSLEGLHVRVNRVGHKRQPSSVAITVTTPGTRQKGVPLASV
jgi:hypothetical protein